MKTAVATSTLVHRLTALLPHSSAAVRKAMEFQGGWMAPSARATGVQSGCVQSRGV